MDTKACRKCGQELPLDSFPLVYDHSYKSRDGHVNSCRTCHWHHRMHLSPSRWIYLLDSLRRHSARAGVAFDVTVEQLREVLGDPSTCCLCGCSIKWEQAHVDHVVPMNRGGATTIGNLRWACKECNLLKRDMTNDELVAHMRRILAHLEASKEHER